MQAAAEQVRSTGQAPLQTPRPAAAAHIGPRAAARLAHFLAVLCGGGVHGAEQLGRGVVDRGEHLWVRRGGSVSAWVGGAGPGRPGGRPSQRLRRRGGAPFQRQQGRMACRFCMAPATRHRHVKRAVEVGACTGWRGVRGGPRWAYAALGMHGRALRMARAVPAGRRAGRTGQPLAGGMQRACPGAPSAAPADRQAGRCVCLARLHSSRCPALRAFNGVHVHAASDGHPAFVESRFEPRFGCGPGCQRQQASQEEHAQSHGACLRGACDWRGRCGIQQAPWRGRRQYRRLGRALSAGRPAPSVIHSGPAGHSAARPMDLRGRVRARTGSPGKGQGECSLRWVLCAAHSVGGAVEQLEFGFGNPMGAAQATSAAAAAAAAPASGRHKVPLETAALPFLPSFLPSFPRWRRCADMLCWQKPSHFTPCRRRSAHNPRRAACRAPGSHVTRAVQRRQKQCRCMVANSI